MTLPKGQHTELNVTQKARHRIMAGLGWNPADKANIIEKVGHAITGKDDVHDLDLGCFTYDAHSVLISTVSADRAKNIDDSGKIYHSGDDEDGIGEGDDEQLSVELKDLEESIHHILFTVKIQSGHVFKDIEVPEIRLADGYSNDNFLQIMIDHSEGKEQDVFVFAHIYRSGEGWSLHNVSEYMNSEEYDDWQKELPKFLTTK